MKKIAYGPEIWDAIEESNFAVGTVIVDQEGFRLIPVVPSIGSWINAQYQDIFLDERIKQVIMQPAQCIIFFHNQNDIPGYIKDVEAEINLLNEEYDHNPMLSISAVSNTVWLTMA